MIILFILLLSFSPLDAAKGRALFHTPPSLTAQTNLYAQKSQNETIDQTFFQLKHLSNEQATTLIQGVYPSIRTISNPETKGILFFADNYQKKQLLKMLYRWDKPRQQCRYDIKIIEISNINQKNFNPGFDFLNKGIQLKYNTLSKTLHAPQEIQQFIQFLLSEGDAKIVAKPHLSMLNQQTASIHIGDQYPYLSSTIKENGFVMNHLQQIDTGISITITPKITSSNHVETTVHCIVSSIKLMKEINGTPYPVISKRDIQTKIIIPNKKTLIIAGLIQENISNNRSKVPLLSKLPFIKKFTTNATFERTQSDILIMITPTLLI